MHDYEGIVIDNGSGMIKAGFAGEDAPKSIFPTLVGRTRNKEEKISIGEEAQRKRGILRLGYPIEKGLIKDWEGMEEIWEDIFKNELKVSQEEIPLLMTEVAYNSKSNRMKITQLMFERFGINKFHLANTLLLSIYAAGRDSGIVVESGESCCTIAPIYQSHVLRYAVNKKYFLFLLIFFFL